MLLIDSVHVTVSRRTLLWYVTLWSILNAMINTCQTEVIIGEHVFLICNMQI